MNVFDDSGLLFWDVSDFSRVNVSGAIGLKGTLIKLDESQSTVYTAIIGDSISFCQRS